MAQKTGRDKYLARKQALWNERSSFDSHWQEIADNLLPRASRFTLAKRNKGERVWNNIYDSTGTKALRVLAAGLMAGMTSPARPWFRLATSDPDLMESAAVKEWLFATTTLMRDIFARSNTYRALHSLYEELGAFGTAASLVVDDFKTIQHVHTLTVGEYAIATDYKGEVNTLYREMQMTTSALVQEFGIENVSDTVRTMFNAGNLDAWIPVYHTVEPRYARDVTKKDNRNMPFASCYFEAGSESSKVLRESGFADFPVLAPRWAVVSGDVYGYSPGMEALGDIKQLQHEQLRKAEAIDYKTKPPVQAPTNYKNGGLDLLPGGVSFVDSASPSGGVRTAFEVNLDMSHLLEDIQDVRGRINSAFYADLFLMLANDTRSGITATEVAERHEEKLLMLGPVLERLHNELLSPMIDITFNKMVKAGVLPPPPPELQGDNLNVEFVSTLAQAQRAVAVDSMDRFVNTIGMVAAVKPEILDKLDADQYADVLADALGIDPSLVVADDKVAIIRQQRAQAQAKAAQAEQAPVMAQTAKTLADTDTTGQNGLTDLMAGLQGYS
jgi:hypothetical protein